MYHYYYAPKLSTLFLIICSFDLGFTFPLFIIGCPAEFLFCFLPRLNR